MVKRLGRVAAATAYSSGVVAWARRFHAERLLAVSYHAVVGLRSPPRSRYRFLYRNGVPVEQFAAHMRYLKTHYTLLGPRDLVAHRARRFPRRAAIVTFDDGLLNNYTVAAPILSELGIPAFFFVPTGFVDAASNGDLRIAWTEEVPLRILHSGLSAPRVAGSLRDILPEPARGAPRTMDQLLHGLLAELKGMPPSPRERVLSALRAAFPVLPHPEEVPADWYGSSLLATMTWSHLRELSHTGMGIGSHTENHSILGRLSEREAEREIRTSMRRIVEEVGPDYRVFAYPNGQPEDFRDSDMAVLEREGFEAAFTQVQGLNPLDQHRLALRRINIGTCPLPTFASLASGLHPRMHNGTRGRARRASDGCRGRSNIPS